MFISCTSWGSNVVDVTGAALSWSATSCPQIAAQLDKKCMVFSERRLRLLLTAPIGKGIISCCSIHQPAQLLGVTMARSEVRKRTTEGCCISVARVTLMIYCRWSVRCCQQAAVSDQHRSPFTVPGQLQPTSTTKVTFDLFQFLSSAVHLRTVFYVQKVAKSHKMLETNLPRLATRSGCWRSYFRETLRSHSSNNIAAKQQQLAETRLH